MIGREEYYTIALQSVCVRDIFFEDSARDAMFLESLRKCQSPQSASNNENVQWLHRHSVIERCFGNDIPPLLS
jgi:hypothetical protein